MNEVVPRRSWQEGNPAVWPESLHTRSSLDKLRSQAKLLADTSAHRRQGVRRPLSVVTIVTVRTDSSPVVRPARRLRAAADERASSARFTIVAESRLTDSLRWIRLIASPKQRGDAEHLDLREHASRGRSGIVSVMHDFVDRRLRQPFDARRRRARRAWRPRRSSWRRGSWITSAAPQIEPAVLIMSSNIRAILPSTGPPMMFSCSRVLGARAALVDDRQPAAEPLGVPQRPLDAAFVGADDDHVVGVECPA